MQIKMLFITELNPYGSSKHGGAESSSRLLAEKLAGLGHSVMHLTKNVTPEQRYKAATYNVRLRRFVKIPRAQRFRVIRKINLWLLSCSILIKCLLSRTQIIYCYYEPGVLEAALLVKRLLPRIKIVMRMAGMHWYEKSVENKYWRARYSRYFSQVDAINFISNDLVSMTKAAMKELNMEGVRFKDSVAVNGASILYSSLREMVLIVTGRGAWGAVQLPTVNFSRLDLEGSE